MNLTGFRTIIVGLFMTIGVPALSYLATIDWTSIGISPTVAFAISGVLMLLMRWISSTPITKPNSVAMVAAMPDIVKIITTADPAGRALADSVPNDKVLAVANPVPQTGVGRRA